MTVTLHTPAPGAVVSALTDDQQRFLTHRRESGVDAESIDWLNLVRKGEEQSLPRPIELTWTLSEELPKGANVCLTLTDAKDPASAKQIPCEGQRCELYHLRLGATYTWQITVLAEGQTVAASETRRFTVSPQTPRTVRAGGLSNVRDLGGFATKDGKRVRQGLFYRGCEMEFHHTITEDGKRVLCEELGIRTDLDLRIEAVRAELCASALGEGVDFVLIPCAAYDGFLREKETAARLFRLFTDPSRYPIYAHCWGGADRTGTLILILSAILGVEEDDLLSDYEFTSLSIWGKRSVRSDLFQAFLTELNTYGNEGDSINRKCEAFLLSCGITPAEINAIRQILTEE